MGVNSLPETVTRQRRDCDLNLGPSEPESSTLTARLYTEPPFGRLITGANSAAPPAGCRDDANARCSACARMLIGAGWRDPEVGLRRVRCARTFATTQYATGAAAAAAINLRV